MRTKFLAVIPTAAHRALRAAALLLLSVSLLFSGPGGEAQQKPDDAANNKPTIEGFFPHVVAPGKDDTYYFRIMGRKFGQSDAKKFPIILFDGGNIGVDWSSAPPDEAAKEGVILASNASSGTALGGAGAPTYRIKGYIAPNEREIEIWGVPKASAHGRIAVKIERSDGAVSEAAELRLAFLSDAAAKEIAGLVSVILFLIPIFGVSTKRSTYTIAGQQQKLWSVFLLDAESNSYSLSKLQFYLWTFAAVFGYVFLTVARSLVQGRFEFADIPENLPGIILVSATTSVVAAGVQAVKGPKGAGDEQPGLSDFVCAGGVVSAERFQFLVWTLLGVGAFLFIIIFSDAASITTLPPIPQQFLMLMGISSAGYLGGKLARKPGPVIDSINVTRSPQAPAPPIAPVAAPAALAAPAAPAAVPTAPPIASLVLEIRGDILSKDASFKVDNNEVKFERKLGAIPDPTPNPEPVEKADDFITSGFAKVLKLTIDNLNNRNSWLANLAGRHQLTIINPDGKLATWNFTV